MRRILLLATALLLASVGMLLGQAQTGSQGAAPGGESETRGCLQASKSGLILKADDGTSYQLQGSRAQLSKLVGKQVLIRGRKGSATDVSAGLPANSGETTSNPTAGAAPTIQVSTATQLTDRCPKK